jgi:hypothetical protein
MFFGMASRTRCSYTRSSRCPEGIAYGRRLGAENDAFTELWLARDVPHPFPLQVAATDRAVEFADKAILRLNQAFKGELRRKKFVSNVEA